MSEDPSAQQATIIRIVPDEVRGFVRIQVIGRFPMRDASQRQAEVASAHPGMHRLWDLREADLSNWTRQEIRGGIEAIASRTPPIAKDELRVAALVTRDLDYGVARMFESMASGSLPIRYAVFRDEPRALEWLATGE